MIFMGSSGAVGRYIPLEPGPTIWWRCLLAMVLLFVYCKVRGFQLKIPGWKKQQAVIVSGVLFASHLVTYFYALKLSSVAIGMLAVFTYPAMTTLLEPILLKQKIQPHHIGLAGLVLVGVFFLVPGDVDLSDDTFLGLMFGLVSALIYSLRNIMMKKQVESIHGSVLMFWQMLVGVVVVAPALFFSPGLPPVTAIPFLVSLGLITTAIGHTLFLGSFKHFSISTASLLSCIQPVYGILLGMLIFGEYPAWTSVIGGALILSAVVVEARQTMVNSKVTTKG
ncbi:EamA family transporter [Neolewinella aurantiaca]|uniref:EamA family transporter n=2 Tax=Neolewinella aurantiaca TaxID=2602767 RepID=A0A5C7FN20_9BACT|nr:EamA family transporter [Neolewinella aurantiaca]